MKERKLGKSGLDVSAMGLGCMGMAVTTKLHRLEENIGAVSLELTPGDLRDTENAASQITVQGARDPEQLERMTGR